MKIVKLGGGREGTNADEGTNFDGSTSDSDSGDTISRDD